MIGVILRIALLGAFTVLLAIAIGLFVMAGVAQSHDVVSIPLPTSSYIASTLPGSSDSDAFITPLRFSSYRDIGRVAQLAFHTGDREVFRDDREVVYEGETAGIHYYISYILMRETGPSTLVVATTVQIQNKKGRYSWMVLKQVNRRLLPYMLDRMSVLAPD